MRWSSYCRSVRLFSRVAASNCFVRLLIFSICDDCRSVKRFPLECTLDQEAAAVGRTFHVFQGLWGGQPGIHLALSEYMSVRCWLLVTGLGLTL